MKETFVGREVEFPGKAVGFRVDRVRLPNGKTATREYLHHPGAVAVIPVLDDGRVVMVQQFRYPVARTTWELPAGKLAKDEDPVVCVRRELEEETGYRTSRLRFLLSFWPTAAFANELIHIFTAEKLRPGPSNPDEDEFLTAKAWRQDDLFAMIRKGQIKDAKTLIGLYAYRFRKAG